MGRAEAKGPPAEWTRSVAIDRYLSNLETLIYALEARELSDEQASRYARLINRAGGDLLARLSTTSRAKDRATARVDLSSS